MTISNGSQGMKRNDIICAHYHRDSKTGNELVELVVLKGSPNATAAADPKVPSGKILSGAVDAYMPLWRIPLDGITVGTPVRLFTPRGALWDSVTQSGEWVVVARPRGYDAYCVASMTFKPNTNTSIDINLPIEAANWDSYSVELQLMNDTKNKVPSFNNISMITNSHSAKGFQIVAWNASGASLSYRIAVTVHVFDAKQ